MNLLFDTSVWIDDLRHGGLTFVLPKIRGKYFLWMDSVASAELLTGCRSRRDRRIVDRLLGPFESAGRVISPNPRDVRRAGEALSKLRAIGQTLKNPGGALLEALQAADAISIGALLVTNHISGFRKLARCMPVSIQSFDEFKKHL